MYWQDFPKLKYVNLSYSEKLTSIPDFTRIANLEELYLDGCKKLGEVHSSIAVHKKLKILSLWGCKSIKSLPSELEMDSLEVLSLRGCSNVNKVPGFGEQMKNLSLLFLSETAIEQIPSSIEHLVGLECLCISNCKSLLGLPSAMCNLKSLKVLDGRRCSILDKLAKVSLEKLDLEGSAMRETLVVMKNLKGLTCSGSVAKSSTSSLKSVDLSDCNIGEGVIPDEIGCLLPFLERLTLRGNNFVGLPASIRFLSNLWHLDLRRCERLEQLPDLPPKRSLLRVDVDDCVVLKRLSDPSKLSEGANVYDFEFSCLNCFGLVEEEDWIFRIFAMTMRRASPVHSLPLFLSR